MADNLDAIRELVKRAGGVKISGGAADVLKAEAVQAIGQIRAQITQLEEAVAVFERERELVLSFVDSVLLRGADPEVAARELAEKLGR